MAKWCHPDERASGSESIQDQIERASDNVAFCPGQTGDAPPAVSRHLHRYRMNVGQNRCAASSNAVLSKVLAARATLR
jgi:hypothetical protein